MVVALGKHMPTSRLALSVLLSSWILLEPPVVTESKDPKHWRIEASAPVAQWEYGSIYDSRQACERALEESRRSTVFFLEGTSEAYVKTLQKLYNKRAKISRCLEK